jgi:hypothetical protein
MTIARPAVWALLGTLGVLTIVALPDLGAGAGPSLQRPSIPGVLGLLVRAADREWDPDVLRTAAMFAALLVVCRRRRLARRAGGAAGQSPCALSRRAARRPGPCCRSARDATAPVPRQRLRTRSDRGDLVLDGESLYGHDYRDTGLERWYPAAGEGGRRQVALDHFAYSWAPCSPPRRGEPCRPVDDYRLLVLLATLALLPAALLFRGPLVWRPHSARPWQRIHS